MNKFVVAFLSLSLIAAATFVLLRIIVPGLVNLHNDGLMVLVFVLIVGMVVGWYYYLVFLSRLLKGEYS